MKKFRLLILFVFLTTTISENFSETLKTSVQGNKSLLPRIFCDKPKFDFGQIDEGPVISHRFKIYNKGHGVLKITMIHDSSECNGCELEGLEKNTFPAEIPNGGSCFIKISTRTSGHPGRYIREIAVETNDPKTPTFFLQVKVWVKYPEVEIHPTMIFLETTFKKPTSSNLKILGGPNIPLKIISVKSAHDILKVVNVQPVTQEFNVLNIPLKDFDPKWKKAVGATIEINLPPTQPIGNFSDEIVIKTNNKKKSEIRVPVSGDVLGGFQWVPREFYFQLQPDSPVTMKFTRVQPYQYVIRSVKSVNQFVRPLIKKTVGKDGIEEYDLVICALKHLPPGCDGKDKVILETNDPDQPEIVIDVMVQKKISVFHDGKIENYNVY